MTTIRTSLALSSSTLAILLSFPVAASAAEAVNGASAPGVIEEIIVTVEKRATSLQKTPEAVRAVRNPDLVRAGATALQNLGKLVPDLKVTNVNQGASVQIRGVSSAGNSPTSDAAVATEFNGADIAKQPALQGFLYDLERVEILKGPQGTLYGRNSNGGSVNFISKKPALDEFSGSGEIEFGSYNFLRSAGDLNAPLGDSAAIRGAFQTYSHDGYMKSGLDDANQQSGRLSMLWRPSDAQTFWIIGDYSHDTSQSDLAIFNMTAKQPGANVYVAADPRDDRFYNTTANGKTPFHRDTVTDGITAQYEWNLDFATWMTLADYRYFNSQAVNPNAIGDGTPTMAPDGKLYPGGGRTYVTLHFETVGFETRLASNDTKPLQWVAGLYLFRDRDTGTSINYVDLVTPTPSNEIANPYQLAQTAAIFGQATYTPPALADLHLTLGGRLNVDEKDVKGIYTRFGLTPFPYNAYVPDAAHTWRSANYKAGASYDLNATSLLYGDVSTGFKAGGYGYGPGVDPKTGPIYKPETITAYELGSKNRFFGQTLQVNLEAWYYTYRNYQTNLVMYGCTPICGGLPVITVTSAGQATYKGATLGLEYELTSDDIFKMTYSSMSARYGTFITAAPPGYSLQPTRTRIPVLTNSITGTGIPDVARWSGVATYRHSFENVFGGALDGQIDLQYRGPDMLYLTDDPVYGRIRVVDHAWATVDLSLRYQPASTNWSVTTYVHNVSDALHPVAGRYDTQIHAFDEAWFPPRTVGVILSVAVQ